MSIWPLQLFHPLVHRAAEDRQLLRGRIGRLKHELHLDVAHSSKPQVLLVGAPSAEAVLVDAKNGAVTSTPGAHRGGIRQRETGNLDVTPIITVCSQTSLTS
eukprot:CAMPEP_0115053072 /NCGR_PEP_ID=MMETSP0227-20121206/3299_1 /TAXON_ID=89957 /ORGANISM="Polarella glacialis, Strain CCMP 1383" /LENGTH=101 /DNA_ID=CAMNT_0002437323 /DNA_START=161 /DNA_END=466 /DNA_ORIENTATION=+